MEGIAHLLKLIILHCTILHITTKSVDIVPNSCPLVCAIACPFGNVPDANGCPTCQCRTDPCIGVSCLSDQICIERIVCSRAALCAPIIACVPYCPKNSSSLVGIDGIPIRCENNPMGNLCTGGFCHVIDNELAYCCK